MRQPSLDVVELLETAGLGTGGTDLFAGEWGEPNAQVLVLDGPADPADIKDLYETPAIQVLARGEVGGDNTLPYSKIRAVFDYLISVPDGGALSGGSCYLGFDPESNIAALGRDEQDRYIYSVNLSTTRNAA